MVRQVPPVAKAAAPAPNPGTQGIPAPGALAAAPKKTRKAKD